MHRVRRFPLHGERRVEDFIGEMGERRSSRRPLKFALLGLSRQGIVRMKGGSAYHRNREARSR